MYENNNIYKTKTLSSYPLTKIYGRSTEISGKKTCPSTGYLTSKKGSIILEKEKKILDRWAEYISELF